MSCPLALLGCSELLGIDEFQPPAQGVPAEDGDGGAAGVGGAGGASLGGTLAWWRALGGAGEDRASSVAAFGDGIVIAGIMQGPVDFGTGAIGVAGRTSLFVAKLGSDGETLAALANDGAGHVEQARVVVAPDGSAIVVGSYRDDAITVGSTNLAAPPTGMASVFVIRLDGALAPSSVTTVADADEVHLGGLDAASNGDVAVGGWVRGQWLPEGLPASTGSSDRDALAMVVASNDTIRWAAAPRAAGDNADQHVSAVAFADDGTLRAAGSFAGSLAFATPPIDSRGASDGYVAGFDAQGGFVSGSELGGGSAAVDVTSLLVHAGGVVIGGRFTHELTVDQALQSAGDGDLFVVSLDGGGQILWSQRYGGSGDDVLHALARMNDDSLVAVGSFSATWQLFDALTPVTSAGGQDVMAMRLASDGTPLWMEGFGRQESDAALSVTLVGQERLVLAGYFVDAAQLGEDVLMTHGGEDGLVASLLP
jgi:uncharacterized protein (AIM24 family)